MMFIRIAGAMLATAALSHHAWSAPAPGLLAQASTTAQPGPLEVEFWRSTERIGTPQAYRAYLEAFPNGFFAKLAAAGLGKPSGSAGAELRPSSQVRGNAALPAAALARIAEDAKTGAITFRVGDVFVGPGPLTVGWFGAKKQFIVPTGRWTVLAAQDHYSLHSHRIQLTSIAFGLFEDNALRSVLTTTFNSRPGPASAQWLDAQQCETANASATFAWKAQAATMRQCVVARTIAKFDPAASWKGDVWETVNRNLLRLDMPASEGRALRTDFYMTDHRSGYMHIVRYDLGAPIRRAVASPGASSDSLNLSLEARADWIKAYAQLAVKGFPREIAMDDLVAGDATPATALPLPE